MMDANKIAKLKEAGHKIEDSCAICKAFRAPRTGYWGTCTKHLYQHGKHTGEPRECSVVAFGWCPAFEWDSVKAVKVLASYVCLMAKEEA